MESIETTSMLLMGRVEQEKDISIKKLTLEKFLDEVENNSAWHKISRSSNLFKDCKWINTNRSLELDDFSGKLVLMDFFTYCCINCMHIMPFLHNLEKSHPVTSGFLVVGIHSAKFPNEKMDENINSAIFRNDILHPVVNDCEIKIWEEFGVTCWPTLILISPSGKVLFSIPGESHTSYVEMFVDVSLTFYNSRNALNKSPLSKLTYLDNSSIQTGTDKTKLRFPGKIAIDDAGERMAISDSGNNRIIISSLNGPICHIIGGEGSGFVDGIFDNAKFNSPQGIAWHGKNTVFVADCNNHSIRKIDLIVKRVVTVAGTGVQGHDLEGGAQGLEQPISSPWDVIVGGSPRFPDGRSILYIAMSGSHQIWAFFLKTTDYQKGAELEMGTCIRYAGNGKEENRNNSYPHKAGFAQPSGLSLNEECHTLYVADSESSTIRRINLTNGAVQGLVGGDIDPTNLFSYGDIDGKGREAKLQHPIGVAWDHKRDLLYIADTYNHKIKILNPKEKTCKTMAGNGRENLILNEPSGLACDPACENLYIADTNNHKIKVISLSSEETNSVDFNIEKYFENLSIDEFDGPIKMTVKPLTSKKVNAIILDQRIVNYNGTINISVTCPGFHLNPDAPSVCQISYSFDKSPNLIYLLQSENFNISGKGVYSFNVSKLEPLPKGINSIQLNIFIESVLYYCQDDSGICKMHSYKAILPLLVDSSSEAMSTEVTLAISQ
uniref:NHL repeat-containing protein 2-like n=1 Tax=Styela clava TaxID=7725 RepID=UPI00193A9DA3|nr:NHL repeat-containing protein 2-like [Styela clava]